MGKSIVELIETQEVIQKLRKLGFSELVDILLENENKVYTKKGRLNKSGACREIGCKTKQLDDLLRAAREALKDEFDLPEEE